ncbi:MAG: WYL domain-containing protein [candidate division Zixibacteria bacterium]|nr:WYL domain-containing protein [candidate division Zixibacteria bacterium]
MHISDPVLWLERTMNKYTRLLFILDTLRHKRGLNARDIAEECGVTERTIYRDLNTLLGAGAPIYYDRGYKLLQKAFLPSLNFAPDELVFINNALENCALPGYGKEEELNKSIRAKINANLSHSDNYLKNSDALVVYPKISFKPDFDDPIFKLLVDAINRQYSVNVEYDSMTSGIRERKVDPYSIVFRGNSWYLIAYCRLKKEIRTFRFNRIHKANPVDNHFNRLPGFSVQKYFHNSWLFHTGNPVEFKVEFRNEAAKVILSGTHHHNERIEILNDKAVIYSAKASGFEEILRWIIGFGPNARIISPPELKEKLIDTLNSTLVLYH